MYNISFGAKIPVASCQIQERATGDFIPAAVYEYDCKDYEDIKKVESAKGIWHYKNTITNDMKLKYSNFFFNFMPPENHKHYYTIEKEDGEIIGMTQTSHKDNSVNISFIETRSNGKYKYAGQALIAAVGMKILADNNDKLYVKCPVNDALDFYKKSCKFSEDSTGVLYMDRRQIKKFLTRTKKRTRAPIINLNA